MSVSTSFPSPNLAQSTTHQADWMLRKVSIPLWWFENSPTVRSWNTRGTLEGCLLEEFHLEWGKQREAVDRIGSVPTIMTSICQLRNAMDWGLCWQHLTPKFSSPFRPQTSTAWKIKAYVWLLWFNLLQFPLTTRTAKQKMPITLHNKKSFRSNCLGVTCWYPKRLKVSFVKLRNLWTKAEKKFYFPLRAKASHVTHSSVWHVGGRGWKRKAILIRISSYLFVGESWIRW